MNDRNPNRLDFSSPFQSQKQRSPFTADFLNPTRRINRYENLRFFGHIGTQGKNFIIYLPRYCTKNIMTKEKCQITVILVNLATKEQSKMEFIGSITAQGKNHVIYVPKYAIEQIPDVQHKKKYKLVIKRDPLS